MISEGTEKHGKNLVEYNATIKHQNTCRDTSTWKLDLNCYMNRMLKSKKRKRFDKINVIRGEC